MCKWPCLRRITAQQEILEEKNFLPILSRSLPGPTDCHSFYLLGVKGVTFQKCEFTTLCYAPAWQCDGSNDCGDFSDERNCPGQTHSVTRAHTNAHINTTCILYPKYVIFISEMDTSVTEKRKLRCPVNFFACPSGRCIPMSWTCDKENDCENGTDETHCG